jgi:hypothetical protein
VALRKDSSTDHALAAKQCLAVAHIEAETVIEHRCVGYAGARWLYSADAVSTLHRELFARRKRGLNILLTSAASIRCRGRVVAAGSQLATSDRRLYRPLRCAG